MATANVKIKTSSKSSTTIPVKNLKPPVNLKKIPKIVLPDLVVENFSVESQRMTEHGSQMHFPVNIRIGNIGNAVVDEPFYVVFEYFRVRVIVDSAVFEEFPPQGGLIKESNEENNRNNKKTIYSFCWTVNRYRRRCCIKGSG